MKKSSTPNEQKRVGQEKKKKLLFFEAINFNYQYTNLCISKSFIIFFTFIIIIFFYFNLSFFEACALVDIKKKKKNLIINIIFYVYECTLRI